MNLPKSYPCPTCGIFCELKTSKNEKPYLVCNECGVQLFFRGKTAIKKIIVNSRKIMKMKSQVISAIYEIIILNNNIAKIENELSRINRKQKLSTLEKRLKTRLKRRLKYFQAEFSDYLQDV